MLRGLSVVYCLVAFCFIFGDVRPAAGFMVETLAEYFSSVEGDLTRITWAHAVNNRSLLKEALKGPKDMIEADIVLGFLDRDQSPTQLMPIMAHPPNNKSDLSLKEFLDTIGRARVEKGVKLDFKTIEAFKASEKIIEDFFNEANMDYPLLLNADIMPGPVDSQVLPVDCDYFLSTCAKKFQLATLSVGWTTRYGGSIKYGSYTPEIITNMTEALNRNSIVLPVTFAVRAGIAAQSIEPLLNLISSSVPGTTLTIWHSSDDDYVDIKKLNALIEEIGHDKVYLDVPSYIKREMDQNSASVAHFAPIVLLITALHLFF